MIRRFAHIILLILLPSMLIGQQIELDRVLIGSGYSEYSNGSTFTLSASVGEPATFTASTTNLIITQGFQQSNYVLSSPLIADIETSSAACIGANNGSASVTFVSQELVPPLVYQWSNTDTGSTISGLEAGLYTVTVTGSNGLSVTNSAWVSPLDSVDCTPGFYTGITPNGDNLNDYWHIDNSEYFFQKEVQIFNRYGALVWESNDYDNISDRFVGAHRNGQPLPVGTYFFIARFDDSRYQGWIEISR